MLSARFTFAPLSATRATFRASCTAHAFARGAFEAGRPLTGSNDSDHQLMQRVADGDAAAFRLLVDRHASSLAAHTNRMLQSESEAEEVVQEAFIRLWRHAPRYRPDAKLRTLLYGIAHNLCIDRLRARRPHDPEALDQLITDDRDHKHLRDRERNAEVQRALAMLPERQRAALSLVHFEELSNADAAALMRISIEALESLLSRARRTLRERLRSLIEQGD